MSLLELRIFIVLAWIIRHIWGLSSLKSGLSKVNLLGEVALVDVEEERVAAASGAVAADRLRHGDLGSSSGKC